MNKFLDKYIIWICLILIIGVIYIIDTYYIKHNDKTVIHKPSQYSKNLGNHKIQTFSRAKKQLQSIYSQLNLKTSFYCDCEFIKTKKTNLVNYKHCSYNNHLYTNKKKLSKRATRIEWEHIVPISEFGQQLDSWTHGHKACKSKRGRKCARKVNKFFGLIEADMHNLVPAIGEVNQLRSNYNMTNIFGEKRNFGSCDLEIYNYQIEPASHKKGNVARIYKYMNASYPEFNIISTPQEQNLFDSWDKSDPVDTAECKREQAIFKIQGNHNNYIYLACKG